MEILKNKKVLIIASCICASLIVVLVVVSILAKPNNNGQSINQIDTDPASASSSNMIQTNNQTNNQIGNNIDNSIPVTKLSLDKTKIVINMKKSTTDKIEATVKPNNATNKQIKWISSDDTIASVDENGNITALAEGRITITASCNDLIEICIVDIISQDENSEPVNEIEEPAEEPSEDIDTEVVVDDSGNTYFNIDEENDDDYDEDDDDYDYEEDDDDYEESTVISQSEKKPEEPKKPAEFTLSIDKENLELSLKNKKQYKLNAKINQEGKIYFSSKDKNIATVDNNGLITAVNEGTTKIIVSSKNKSKSCNVVVKTDQVSLVDEKENDDNNSDSSTSVEVADDPTPQSSVNSSNPTSNAKPVAKKASLSNSNISLTKNQTKKLTFTILEPVEAKNNVVTWTSSNEKVATVDKNGNVKAISTGTANITATVDKLKATCKVTVAVETTSVTLSARTVTLNAPIQKVYNLKATVLPANANQSVTWKSSNSNVASVDKNGKVIARGKGTATITATSGNKSASCNITVNENCGYTTSSYNGMEYGIYIPPISTVKDLEKLPLIIYLHGGQTKEIVYVYSKTVPPGSLVRQNKYGAIFIFPLYPASFYWERANDNIVSLINYSIRTYNVDPNRIGLTGFSYGGMGALSIGLMNPNLFSSVVAVSPSNNKANYFTSLDKAMPTFKLWIFTSTKDGTAYNNNKLIQTLRSKKVNFILSETNNSHVNNRTAAYINSDVLGWMLQQKRTDK